MNRKTLFGLIVCNFAVFTMGNGFLPLMPIYAGLLGASRETAGLYIAFAYFCIALGTVIGGRLSDSISNRKLFLVITGTLFAPITWLLGKAGNLWQLTLCTGLQYLIGGLCLAVTGAITGREAGPKERGKVFGLLGMTIGLGALAGGLSIGPMVDAWGYRRMFTVMAAFLLIIPLAALVMVRETSSVSEKAVQGPVKQRGRFEKVLFLLFAAQIFGMIANGLGNMARSISMSGLSFTNTAITTTAAVSGLIAIPLALFLGWLSDKLGRKLILIISHAAGTLCLVLLVISFRLWHFWIAASLLSVVVVSMSVGPAFVADIVKKESVGTGIALFQGAQWLGIIAGFVYSGYAFKAMGFSSSLFAASGAGIIAALLILFLRTSPPAGDSGR